jgi:hypothetical protein
MNYGKVEPLSVGELGKSGGSYSQKDKDRTKNN